MGPGSLHSISVHPPDNPAWEASLSPLERRGLTLGYLIQSTLTDYINLIVLTVSETFKQTSFKNIYRDPISSGIDIEGYVYCFFETYCEHLLFHKRNHSFEVFV